METSIFLAQFWGWLLLIVSILFLIRGKVLVEELFKMAEDRMFIMLSGWISLILGLVTVILHNAWNMMDWRLAVTIFGWIAIVKGVVRIGFPGALKSTTMMLKGNTLLYQVLLVICALIGAWLVWATCPSNLPPM